MEACGRYIGAGLSTVGLGGAAVGSGIVLSASLKGIGRNPSLEQMMFTNGMIFFALVESMALFSLIIAIIILYG